ncbi:MAG TPA: hypothetical protein VH722_15425 [Alphaproteobacteria bacterium]|jgi:hypothetical protein|nr:hypothetical protein [Alphaproteobacteria bacterium]
MLSLLLAAPAMAESVEGGLGTVDQVRIEALASRVLATPEVQEARREVEDLFHRNPTAATEAGRATLEEAVRETVYAALIATVAEDPAHPALVWTLNAPHDWFDISVPGSRYGIDNPDNVYRLVLLDGAASYEIKGHRRGAGPTQFGFEVLDGAPGLHGIGKHLGFLSDNEIKGEADGSFTITLGPDAAAGKANHIQTSPAAKALLIRDTLGDWDKDRPNDLTIRRVGAVDGGALGVHQLALAAAHNLPAFAAFWLNFRDHALARNFGGQVNVPGKVTPREGGWGFAAPGQFQLQPDEALVVTVDTLGARYVGFELTDPWAISAEYIRHQGSLNNHQAVPNADGTITYVIAARDPGVTNWLDTSGLTDGFFQIRWQKLAGTVDASGAVKSSKVVKIADLPPGPGPASAAWRRIQAADRVAAYAHRLEN